MSQAQSQSKPPPLREVLFQAEAEETAKDQDQFYKELHATEGADASPPLPAEPALPPEPAPAPSAPAQPEVRGGYRRTGNNVYQLDNIWQNAPAHLVENGPRPARPRPARRPKHVPVKKHYRVGRAIATLFAMIGWLMILAALAVSSVSLLQPVLVAQFGMPNFLGGVAGSLFVGLLTVSIGLAARAQFDQAKATFDQLNAAFDQAAAARELVAMERARMGA
jgi:hypothetical protein